MEPFLSSSFFTSTSILLLSVALLFYLYLKYVVYNFWTRQGIPHESPSVPFGNVPLSYFTGKTLHGSIIKKNYLKFKKSRFCGIYILWEPILIINDPELIRLVLVKNFNQFCNRGRLCDEYKDPLSATVLRMNDEKWKRLRGKLSPAFTSGKLKLMYPLIKEICHRLISSLDKTYAEGDEIDLKEFATRYTVDCISSIAYGFNADTLHDADSLFYKYGKLGKYVGRVFLLFTFFFPQLRKYIPLPKKRKDNEIFFTDLFFKMVEQRRKENIPRNDILSMIMELVDYGSIDEGSTHSSNKQADKLTLMEGVAQSFMFFSAGQETTSSLITCCLYELALNPDVQHKLYDEICRVHEISGGLTYDKVFDMQYLDMVVKETHRKYLGTAILTRICTEDFEVPDSNFIIKKGMLVIIPVVGLHADPDIYPEPEKFDPERFTPENKAKRHNFTYLPFGEGPRQCMAKRLGLLKARMALFHLVSKYQFSSFKDTPDSIKFLPDFFVQIPCKVPLKIKRRIGEPENI